MQHRSSRVEEILSSQSSDIKVLKQYINSLERANSQLMSSNQQLSEQLTDVRSQNFQLKEEHIELENNLSTSKQMLETITDLFQKITDKNSQNRKNQEMALYSKCCAGELNCCRVEQ